MAINGEGIYGTRPWKTFGEGPGIASAEKGSHGGLKDVPTKPYTAEDFRFTASKDGKTLYAFCFGIPDKEFRIRSLGTDAKLNDKPIASVAILGSSGKPAWKQEPAALVIASPAAIPDREAVCIRISFQP